MKKVTAKHLMIGDWVMCRKQYCIVTQLPIVFDEHRIMLQSTHRSFGSSSATPIPITEEWLMLNGFELSASTNAYVKKSAMVDIYYTCSSMDLEIDMIDGYYTSNPIQYIHQLQQAYRLATGKELKIKF